MRVVDIPQTYPHPTATPAHRSRRQSSGSGGRTARQSPPQARSPTDRCPHNPITEPYTPAGKGRGVGGGAGVTQSQVPPLWSMGEGTIPPHVCIKKKLKKNWFGFFET